MVAILADRELQHVRHSGGGDCLRPKGRQEEHVVVAGLGRVPNELPPAADPTQMEAQLCRGQARLAVSPALGNPKYGAAVYLVPGIVEDRDIRAIGLRSSGWAIRPRKRPRR